MAVLKLRAFKNQDADSILRIAKSLGYFSLKDLKNIKLDVKRNHCIIASVNSKPAGFIVFNASKPKGKSLLQAKASLPKSVLARPRKAMLCKVGKKACGKILWLAVKGKYQGFGLGGKLLKRAESRIKARKASKVLLHTFGFSGNYFPFFKVRDFYYRHGFQRLREIPNGFMPGVDKLVMFKEFG